MTGQMSVFDFLNAASVGPEKPKPRLCRNCSHMQRSVYGLAEYHGFSCFGFGISKSEDINRTACSDYKPATDGEAWRTSDKAAEDWRGW